MHIITGVNGHGHVPPVFQHGPYAAGAADTNPLDYRPIFVLPPAKIQVALTTVPEGSYTLLHFYNTFLQADLASADPAVVNAAQPLRDWY